MSRDPLRDALDRLAGEAPVELRRSEQVWARYRRRRRRTVAAGVGTAAALVAAVALVAPLRGGSHVLLPASPPPTTANPAVTAPPATPVGRPAVGVPAPPPDGSGAVHGAGRGTASAPATPGAVSPTGPGEWPAGVELLVGPTRVRPYDEVLATAFPYAGDNGIYLVTFDWGDGTKPVDYPEPRSCPRDGDRVVARNRSGGRHTYDDVGTYVVTVTVRFAGCGRPEQVRTATSTVVVADDAFGVPPVGGGPLGAEQVAVRSAPSPLKRAVTLRPEAGRNTVIGFLVVEWGDGTATVLRPEIPDRCDVPASPDPAWPAYVEHVYPRPGDYPVMAYAVGVTCPYGQFGTTSEDSLRLRAGT